MSPLRSAARKLVRELNVLSDDGCAGGYSPLECHVLTEIALHKMLTVSDLETLLLVDKSQLSRVTTRLLELGDLLVHEDKADRRRKPLRLTKNGETVVADINAKAEQQVADARVFLDDSSVQMIADGMEAYARALQYARLSATYSIRRITENDSPVVGQIIRDVMTEFGCVGQGYSINDAEVDSMYDVYSDAGHVYYVIERDGVVLGGGGLGPLIGGDDHICELKKMYFRPDLRGTGAGYALLKRLLDEAPELGYRECYLETASTMHYAAKLYKKFGFVDLSGPMGQTGHNACDRWMLRELGGEGFESH